MRSAVRAARSGIVLVRGRYAEVRADPVALVRLHRAAVLVDGATHHRHALADEHLRLVGLESFAERRRADDVREEDGDGAPLVFDLSRAGAAGARRPGLGRLGYRRCRRCEPRDRTERVVLAKDRLLEPAQLGVWLEAELVVEELPERSVRLECVGMATRAVEGDHELRAKPLVERVERDERLQLAYGLGLAPHREHCLEARFERFEPQPVEPCDLRLRERLRRRGRRVRVPARAQGPERGSLPLRRTTPREAPTSRQPVAVRTPRRRGHRERRAGGSRVAP